MAGTFIRRPVSPLQYEPLEAPLEEVLLPGSDEEDGPTNRKAKRQRIEGLGEQYLLGKSLFILSAGLHGPFHDKWVNPWARHRTGPQLESRADERQKAARQEWVNRNDPRRNARLDTRGIQAPEPPTTSSTSRSYEMLLFDEPKPRPQPRNEKQGYSQRSEALPSIASDKPDDKPRVAERDIKNDDYSHTHGGEDWLRSDKTLLQDLSRRRSTSPSPVHRKRQRKSYLTTEQLSKQRHDTTSKSRFKGDMNSAQGLGFRSQHFPRSLNDPHTIKPAISGLGDPVSLLFDDSREPLTIEQKTPTRDAPLAQKNLSSTPPSSQSHGQIFPQDGTTNHGKESQQDTTRRLLSFPLPQPKNEISKTFLDAHRSRQQGLTKYSEQSSHEFTPSTNLLEFQYDQVNQDKASSSNENRFPEMLAAAKTHAVKRLNSTSLGHIKVNKVVSSNKSPVSQDSLSRRTPKKPIKLSQNDASPDDALVGQRLSEYSVAEAKTSGSSLDASKSLPEAQIVSARPDQNGKALSGPSTDLLETDKQSLKFLSTEERDLGLNISSQAGFTKPSKSFQTDISPFKTDARPFYDTAAQTSPVLMTRAFSEPGKLPITPFSVFREMRTGAAHNELKPEPQSSGTRFVVEAVSPLAINTVKKPSLKKKTSFAPSPTDHRAPLYTNEDDISFGKLGLDMETTPDSSSPEPDQNKKTHGHASTRRTLSGAPSDLSILSNPNVTRLSSSAAANWTTSEAAQQDGQRPPEKVDLTVALDEAGSFLGSWDVEHEARKGASEATSVGPTKMSQRGRRRRMVQLI